jgi:radical SAM superfamily enzyme YgiQ (UPF0313 family)
MRMFHVKHNSPSILLVNPWITDFAAYNFWIKPYGLLCIASLLREAGLGITLIDCLDFNINKKRYGDGKFYKSKFEKPYPLKDIPRFYSQYGIPEKLFLERLSSIEKPDLIGITSGMTYWYPGLFKTVEILRDFFRDIPIILGGIYANLCYEHALNYSGADIVYRSENEFELFKIIEKLTNMKLRTPNSQLGTDIYPAFDLYPQLDYVSMMTSRGCPFHCPYCASPVLSRGFQRRDPIAVVEEIEYWTTHYQVQNIAFYDDALLINPAENIVPILKKLIDGRIYCNFHTPNGLHIREIDREVADLLFRCQFKTIRLSLETSNELTQMEIGGKVGNREFEEAVRNLKRAGYSGKEIGVYIMVGLPGQRVGEVEESIAFVKEKGAKPIIVEYSPIPHTPMFEKAKQMSKFDIENEPLFQKNSILPCQWEGLTGNDYRKLKEKIKA